MEMTIEDVIKTRRTIHLYEEIEIDDSLLDRFLEAGHFAPNHKLTWPWRFTVVGHEGRAKIADRAVELKSEGRTLTDGQVSKIRAKITTPSALVIVSQLTTDNAFQSKEDYAAVSCAIQNISLLAHAEGWGTKWSTGGITRDPCTYEVAGLDSEEQEIVGFLWVGKAKVTPTIKRPDFGTLCRRVP